MRKRIECISEVREIAFPDTWYKLASGDHFWFRWRFAAFLNQLRELGLPLVQERRLLEIGCGTGVLSSQLEAHSKWRVDGADLNLWKSGYSPTGAGKAASAAIPEPASAAMILPLASLALTSALRNRTKAVRSGVGSVLEKPQNRRKDARSSTASASFTSDRSYQTDSSSALCPSGDAHASTSPAAAKLLRP